MKKISDKQRRVLSLIDGGLAYDFNVKTPDQGIGRFRTLRSLLRRKLIRYGNGTGRFTLTAAGDEALRESQ